MGKPVVGEIVVLPFPQTDLKAGKRRPALVIAELVGDDLILVSNHKSNALGRLFNSHKHFRFRPWSPFRGQLRPPKSLVHGGVIGYPLRSG